MLSISYKQKIDESALSRLIFRICSCSITARLKQRFVMGSDHIAVDDDFLHIPARWNFVHHVEQHILDDTAQPPRSRTLLERTFCSSVKSIIGKD